MLTGSGGALLFVIAIAIGFGLLHGLLVTKLNLQPFGVILCGLFIYRGIARFYTNDVTQGFGSEFLGLKFLAGGKVPEAFWADGTALKYFMNWSLPMPFIILVFFAVILAIFLNRTIYGRTYWPSDEMRMRLDSAVSIPTE